MMEKNHSYHYNMIIQLKIFIDEFSFVTSNSNY